MKILKSTKKCFSDLNAKSLYSQSSLFKDGIMSLTKSFHERPFGASILKGICVREGDI